MIVRHLLFFLTGALLALAVVVILRASDDGSAARSAGRAGAESATMSTSAAGAVPRSVRLRSRRPALRGHRGEGSAAVTPPTSKAPATVARGTGGTARPRPGGAGAEPSPGTSAVPAATAPDDTTETVPDAGGPTEPPSDPPTSTDTATPPAGSSTGGVTIPNPATPDASVGP